MDNTEKMVTFDTQDTRRRQTIHKRPRHRKLKRCATDAPETRVNPDHNSGLVQFLSAVLEDCFKIFKEKRSSFS